MHGYVSDGYLVSVASQRPAWRWTELVVAIRDEKHCCEATAARAIRRAVRYGVLVHHEATYQIAEDAEALLAAPYCYHRLDRRAFLQIMAERSAWAYTELMDEVCIRLDTTENSAQRSLRYGRQYGYIRRTGDWRWALTPLCREQLAMWGQLEGAEGFRFATYLSGHPKRGFQRWSTDLSEPTGAVPGHLRFPAAGGRLLWNPQPHGRDASRDR